MAGMTAKSEAAICSFFDETDLFRAFTGHGAEFYKSAVRHLASGRIGWRVEDIKKRPASFAGNSSQDELKAFSPFWITKQIIAVRESESHFGHPPSRLIFDLSKPSNSQTLPGWLGIAAEFCARFCAQSN